MVDGKVVSEGSGLYGSTIPYPSNPTKDDVNGKSYKVKTKNGVATKTIKIKN